MVCKTKIAVKNGTIAEAFKAVYEGLKDPKNWIKNSEESEYYGDGAGEEVTLDDLINDDLVKIPKRLLKLKPLIEAQGSSYGNKTLSFCLIGKVRAVDGPHEETVARSIALAILMKMQKKGKLDFCDVIGKLADLDDRVIDIITGFNDDDSTTHKMIMDVLALGQKIWPFVERALPLILAIERFYNSHEKDAFDANNLLVAASLYRKLLFGDSTDKRIDALAAIQYRGYSYDQDVITALIRLDFDGLAKMTATKGKIAIKLPTPPMPPKLSKPARKRSRRS